MKNIRMHLDAKTATKLFQEAAHATAKLPGNFKVAVAMDFREQEISEGMLGLTAQFHRKKAKEAYLDVG